jgi:hypothetical protein
MPQTEHDHAAPAAAEAWPFSSTVPSTIQPGSTTRSRIHD